MSWAQCIDNFHQHRPGITEDILARATRNGLSPYRWLLQPLPAQGAMLDVACGSAPLARAHGHGRWVGADRSPGELARASGCGATPLVRADAAALPFASGAFSGVICSMAIMLLQPLDRVLAEIRRVLMRGGPAVFMLPGSRPLTAADLLRYGQLMAALRRSHLAYPNDRRLTRLSRLLHHAGFEPVADERLRFTYPIEDEAAARRFIDSLYLPAVPEARIAQASRTAARWAGQEIGIPLRRIIVRAT